MFIRPVFKIKCIVEVFFPTAILVLIIVTVYNFEETLFRNQKNSEFTAIEELLSAI